MRVATVTAITVPHITRAVAAVGGDVAAVLGDYELRPDVTFRDRIPATTLAELWERAIAVTGRRDLPGVACEYSEHDERSLVLFVVAHQPRLSTAIEKFHRYSPTVSDAYCWTVVEDEAEVRLVTSPVGPIERLGWQCHLEFEALDAARAVVRLTGGAGRARAVRFMHAAPPELATSYTRILGLAPVFGADRCEVVFPASIRDLAVPTARPALAQLVEAELAELLDAHRRNAIVTVRARAAIGQVLDRSTEQQTRSAADAARALGVEDVARALAMSRRSLERALADEGTSASELIEDERKQRALAWLPSLSVDEVAARLGYSDTRAFARAFKRWTGVPPSQARGVTADRR